jgi:hypothetical protein
MTVFVVGVVTALGLTLRCRAELASGEIREDARPTLASKDVTMPAYFRQNQPRHWRNLMLAPGR